MMKATFFNRVCAYPVAISWAIGACVWNFFLFATLRDVALAGVVSDWQDVAYLLGFLAVNTCLGFFLGMFTCWPWVRRICSRFNVAPLKVGDRVLILAGPHRGTATQVYEITIGQGGWELARLDIGPEHRYKFTDILKNIPS